MRTSGFLPKFRGKTSYFQLAFVHHLLFFYRDLEVSGRQCRVLRDQEDSFCCWFGHRAFALTSLGHVPAPVPQFPSLDLYLPYLVKITGGMRGSFLGIVEPQICRGFCMAGECRCCCKECQPECPSLPLLCRGCGIRVCFASIQE